MLVVVRAQACDPVPLLPPHAPPEQRYEVTARVWVPPVSQVLAKPPQAPHAP